MDLLIGKILSFVLILSALIGNTLVIITWSRKRFKSFYVRTICCLEAFFEILSALQIFPKLLIHLFGVKHLKLSRFSCKVLETIEYNIPTISAYLLVSISVERLVSIQTGSKLSISKRILLLRVLILTTFVYMLPFFILFSISFDLYQVQYGNIFAVFSF